MLAMSSRFTGKDLWTLTENCVFNAAGGSHVRVCLQSRKMQTFPVHGKVGCLFCGLVFLDAVPIVTVIYILAVGVYIFHEYAHQTSIFYSVASFWGVTPRQEKSAILAKAAGTKATSSETLQAPRESSQLSHLWTTR